MVILIYSSFCQADIRLSFLFFLSSVLISYLMWAGVWRGTQDYIIETLAPLQIAIA